MGFRNSMAARVAIRAGYLCEVCGKDLYNPDPNAVADGVMHSGTSMHLVDGPEFYLVTDPPETHMQLKGKKINGKLFESLLAGYEDDAYFVCRTCHRDIHIVALSRMKTENPDFKGKLVTPEILLEVTVAFVGKRRF